MQLFGKSVRHYVLKSQDLPSIFPENGYKGDYVEAIAQQILQQYGPECTQNNLEWFQKTAQDMMLARQKSDLEAFQVHMDTWFSEQSLHDSGKVSELLNKMEKEGVAEYREGALWLKSTLFGDDKDRVLIRSDGRPSYAASDVAYHQNKLERGFTKLIDIFGPDHHGYIGRMKAIIQALGYPANTLEIIIFQIVRLLRDGKVAPMRKRDGNIYALSDLIQEIGADNARFFYLMRSHETHMDFDIDLAKQQSDENPVYYVQYAHARICSILKKAAQEGFRSAPQKVHLLTDIRERNLIKKILDISHEVQRCAKDYGVHRLTTYSIELARAYHHFYDVCRVIQPDQPELTGARLYLCEATQKGFKDLFNLLGISAPEYMERPDR
jgi:arginyl-tRNA synthetase